VFIKKFLVINYFIIIAMHQYSCVSSLPVSLPDKYILKFFILKIPQWYRYISEMNVIGMFLVPTSCCSGC